MVNKKREDGDYNGESIHCCTVFFFSAGSLKPKELSSPSTTLQLVGGDWLPSIFNFPINIGLLIIPTDELIFFRGVAQPPTRLSLRPEA